MAKTASQTQWEDLASKIKAAGREILYGTSATAAGTAAKVATTTKGTFVLETGAMVRIKFTNANSFNGTATLAVDGTTAKNIVQKGTTTTTRYWWDAGEVVDFVYDGTNFVIVDGAPATTTYYGITKLADSDSSTSTALALVPNSLYTTANNTICPYYSASKTYALGDKVRYSKKLYKCTTAITTAEAWTAAHWTAIDPLQQQLDEAAFIGTSISPSSTTVFVQTANIADGAVTSAKLAVSSIIDIFYPVGSYYETSDTTFNPNTAWGGTWVEDSAGLVTVAKNTGTFSTVGASGGEEEHQLTTVEMPSHNHTLSFTANSTGAGTTRTYGTVYSSSNQSIIRNATVPTSGELAYWGVENKGGDAAHNNLQPYIVVKRWHRTA